MMAAREIIHTLEAQADSQDALARRAIDELADLSGDIDALEGLNRRAVEMAQTRSSFIVEAAMLLRDVKTQPHQRRLFEAMFPGASLPGDIR